MSAKLNVLMPIEVMNRDLDAALLLAWEYLRPHRRIFIGEQSAIDVASRGLRGGVYVGKVIAPHHTSDLTNYHALKERGFQVLYLDTEGAVYVGDQNNWKRGLSLRLDPTRFEAEDYVCSWGDYQRDYYRSLEPKCAGNVRTTGHPRFDLYRDECSHYYRVDRDRILAQHGPFVLVNTNFSPANNPLRWRYTLSKTTGYDPKDTPRRDFLIREWVHLTKVLADFVKLVHRMSTELRGVNVVIRPHPSEDVTFYEHAFEGIDNVRVVREGPVAPWLAAASVLVHNDCTTGIEAFLAGCPNINYKPHAGPAQERFLPAQFGLRCTAEDDVMAAVRAALEERSGVTPGNPDPLAFALLENLREYSLPKLLAVMEEAEGKVRGPITSGSALDTAARETKRMLVERAKDVARPIVYPERRSAGAFYGSKFPGFNMKNVKSRLAALETFTPKAVKTNFISKKLMTLELD